MIQVKRLSGETLITLDAVPEGALVHRELMADHYVKLPFDLDEPVYLRLGDYIELPDFGRFELIFPYAPKFDVNTGAYKYDLQLDAYYMKWKNKKCRYIPTASASETSFHLTATVATHLNVIVNGINAVGDLDSNFRYNQTTSFRFVLTNFPADKVDAAKYMQYDNIDFITALNNLAALFECEWWVEANIIYFGKCQLNGEEVEFELDQNVEEMTSSESSNEFATRIIAFGSTRNLPSNYRKNQSADITVNGVVQKRLMLPASLCPRGYVQDSTVVNETEAVEAIVIDEDIYPHVDCVVSRIETYEKTVEDEETGETITRTYYRLYDGSGFDFSTDMILEGETLHILFQSGAMNGMDFECYYDDTEKYYEVVANEDYGRFLPDPSLHPSVNDKFVLLNWDATKIAETGIIDNAEHELYRMVCDKLEDMKIDPNTYTCVMRSYEYSDMMDRESFVKYDIGQRARLINPTYFQYGRSSRIIGYEIKLDIPYDTPKYIVGEATAYSHMKDMQGQIDAITYNGVSYSGNGNGGGSGIYLITSTDTTPSSDSNAYSAKRSDRMFLRRDKADTAYGAITFMQGLISQAYTQFGAGADFGQFIHGLVSGDGARIDKHGNMEATSLVLRSFLEAPKLVYNHVDVRVGDEWQTNGAGEIESAEVDQNNPLQGTIKLHLLDGEYGTLKVGDKCKGIYHNLEGYNDNVTHDDGKGGRTFAGFYTSYFVVTGVSGTYNQYLTYELRPTIEVNGNTYWQNDEGTSSGIRGGFHPSAHMVFAQYSNAQDNTRQSCQYRTTTYTRMLSGMTGWDEGLANVAFQIGNTPLIASAYDIPDAGRYSLWVNGDIYFAGTLNRIDSWGREVEDYPDQGDYSSATQYHLNDLVHYNGTVYRMTIDDGRTKGVLPGTSVVIDGQTVYPWQKWIWADGISPEGHWSSTKTPYKVNSIVNLYTNIYMSKRQTSNAPMQLLMDKEGRYITTEDGGYIIIDDTTNEDWELLLNVGDITNGRDGENALYINLTNDTDSVLTDEKGNITGSLPTTTGQLYSGTTLITQGVVWGVSTQSGCTASISASTGVLNILTMIADEASVVVTATYNERTYGKVFTFKKLYGRDKMWLELGNDVIKYDLETKTFSPSSITLYAYRTSIQNYDKELVTADSVGWIEVGNDRTHKHSRDVVTISMSSFTNGHLIILLRDSNGDIQDVEDIVLVQDTLQLKPVGHWTSTLQVIKNNIVEFYDGTFVALQDSVGVPPVMSLLTNQNGDYITNDSGGYIIINDTVNTTYWRRLTTNGKNGVDGKDGEDGKDGDNAVTYTLSVTPTSFVRNADGNYKSTATVNMQVYRNEGDTSTLLDNIMLPKLKVYVDGTLHTPSWVAAEYEWQYTLPKGASVVEARLYNGDNIVVRQSISIAQDGSEGLQGCVVRVSEWKASTPYRNDEGRNVTPGFIDVVAREDSSQSEGYRFYQLQRLAGDTWVDEYRNSTPPENDSHWKAVSNVGPIYTSLLIAKNAFIKFGSTNQFVVVNSSNQIEAGMKGDGNIRFFAGSSGTAVTDGSISNAPYRVYKDGSFYATNAHIEGYVKATDGEFTGTITAKQGGNIGGFKVDYNLSLYAFSDGLDAGSRHNGHVDSLTIKPSGVTLTRGRYDNSTTISALQSSIIIGPAAELSGDYHGNVRIVNRHSDTSWPLLVNFGIYLDVQGARNWDDDPTYGNHALLIAKGNIAGFRKETRRVGSSQTLSIYDNNVICTKKNITLTLPNAPEDGQEYTIIPYGRVYVAASGSDKIRYPNGASYTTATFDDYKHHWLIYDSVNKLWLADWGG